MISSTRLCVLLISLLISQSIYAVITAKVIKVRGEVSKLLPGALTASILEQGELLPEDTSVLTGSRSFVRLKIGDSQVSLGPNSKIVISQIQKNGADVLSLLKGRLRSNVKKSSKTSLKNRDKLLIHTRTAALGVRGTEFQALYNPENKVTNLLTYKGEVAMAKIDDDFVKKVELKSKKNFRNLKRSKTGEVKISEITEIDKISKIEASELSKLLETKKTVSVKPGQFSGVSDTLVRASEPVKISPAQFGALYNNTTLSAKGDKNIKSKKASSAKVGTTPFQAEQTAPPEGFYDQESGKFAPKAGGFIDLNTGIYVAPSATAAFQPNSKVYIADNVGSFDASSGDYIAPKGIELNATKGFVAEDKSKAVVAQTESLNSTSRFDLWSVKKDKLKVEQIRILANREIFTKDMLTIGLGMFSSSVEVTGNSLGTNQKANNGGQNSFHLIFDHQSNGKWQLINEFAYKSVDFADKLGSYEQKSTGLFSLGIGFRRFVSNRWNFITKLLLDQELLYDINSDGSNTTREMKKITFFKWYNGVEGDLIRIKDWAITTKGLVFLSPKKETGDFETALSLGLEVSLGLKYWSSHKNRWMLDFYATGSEVETTSNEFSATQNYSHSGIKLFYSRLF